MLGIHNIFFLQDGCVSLTARTCETIRGIGMREGFGYGEEMWGWWTRDGTGTNGVWACRVEGHAWVWDADGQHFC